MIAPVWPYPLRSVTVAVSRQARGGIPISVKLIATMSIVVAAAVGISMVFAQRAIGEVSRWQIEKDREEGQQAIAQTSELAAQAVAAAVAFSLMTSTFDEVEAMLAAAIDQDRRNGDRRLVWLLVRDGTGTVVAKTAGAP
jgi:hypothetical protein